MPTSKYKPPDFSAIEETNPELKAYLDQSLNRPQTPLGILDAAYPGIGEFFNALGVPFGAGGLFHPGHGVGRSAQIDTSKDEVLSGFEPEVLAAMPRVSAPGQVQVADSKGRQHDAFDVQQRVDKQRGIVYSQASNPNAANKLLGGS
jgi:hypothetical protein